MPASQSVVIPALRAGVTLLGQRVTTGEHARRRAAEKLSAFGSARHAWAQRGCLLYSSTLRAQSSTAAHWPSTQLSEAHSASDVQTAALGFGARHVPSTHVRPLAQT